MSVDFSDDTRTKCYCHGDDFRSVRDRKRHENGKEAKTIISVKRAMAEGRSVPLISPQIAPSRQQKWTDEEKKQLLRKIEQV